MAKFALASKGPKSDGNYWLKVAKPTPEGYVDEGFLTVTKKLYDEVVVGQDIEVPDARANRIEWGV